MQPHLLLDGGQERPGHQEQDRPTTNVFVLYRDIRTYGFREIYYKKAREAGVVFLRYTPEQAPVVSETGGLKVSVNSPDFPEPIEIEADLVVLSTGVEADRENNKRVSDMLKVPLNADGFFVEAHMKLRPVDFATEGIFLCGLAHSPKFIDENIAQARAAAARAATVLSKTHLDVSAQVSYVDQSKCISCMTCVHVCPYGAPFCNTGRQGPDRGGQVHGLRHLRLRVSGPGDSAESFRDRPVPRDDSDAVRRGKWSREAARV